MKKGKRERIGKGELRGVNHSINLVMRDVIYPMILVARSRAVGIFVNALESGPQPAVSFAIAGKQYFFRRNLRNSRRIVLKDKFVVSLAVFFFFKKAGPTGIYALPHHASLPI